MKRRRSPASRLVPPALVPRGLLVALLLVFPAVSSPLVADPGPEVEDGDSSRIVAVGDIHGELEGFRSLLRTTGLLDEEGGWAGGSATLVQLGDYLDRGPDVRGVMDLLMRLQDQARGEGGEVVVLLGNHEQMNLLTLYRDVSFEALEAFADEESEARRERAYEEWVRWEKTRRAQEEGGAAPGSPEHRKRWMKAHPQGWLEYHSALGPEGLYGKWIRERSVVAVRGGALFLHAGLSPEYADRSLEEINRQHRQAFDDFDRVRRYLVSRDLAPSAATYDELRSVLVELVEELEADAEGPRASPPPVPGPILSSLGRDFDGVRWTMAEEAPLWFRGYARWPDEALRPLVEETLATHGADRMAAGHSPRRSASIQSRLGGQLFLVDTGMLAEVYGGRASALEIEAGRVTAIYPDSKEVLVGESEGAAAGEGRQSEETERSDGAHAPPPRSFRGADGEPLAFAREEELLAFLRQAPIVESKPLNQGVTGARRLILETGEERVRAVFHDVDVDETGPTRLATGETTMFFLDSHRSQVAAYRLARLMGLRRVPPTVLRRVHGERGSVQLWIENGVTWKTLQEEDLESPDPARLRRQMAELRVFDNLIHNTDRNQGNILFDEDWNLWWIDNTRSFSQHRELVAPELVKRCSRALWEGLQSLDEEAVREALRPLLSIHEIRALMVRRDLLVELLEKRISELGEERVLFSFEDPPAPSVKVRYE